MTFFWVIVILLVLLLITIDPRSWGQWAREGWTDLGIMSLVHAKSDFEIRGVYRKRACEHVPVARPCDPIRFPDPVLDRLIFEERFDKANEYRMKQMMMARERRDKDAVQNYAVYKAHISAREAEADERMRHRLREKYPKLVRKEGEEVAESVEYAEIVGESAKEAAERKRMGFLEIEWKRLPLNLIPMKPKPSAEQEIEPNKGDDPEDDDFTDLISV